MSRAPRHAVLGPLGLLRHSDAARHLRPCRLILVLLLAVAACGPLPRPFQPEYKDANPLVGIRDGPVLHVLPISRQAPGDPARTAEALAAALRARNLPATAQNPGATARTLRGRAVVQEVDGIQEEVLLYWELQSPAGQRIAAHSQRGRLPKGAWRAGDPGAIEEVLDDTAEAVARLLQDPASAPQAVPGFPGARLVILPIRGAPGDGSLSLAQALAEELAKAGLPLAEHPGNRDLLIDCQVSLGPDGRYWREISFRWALRRAKGGEELGRIDQASRVPAEELEGPWGSLSVAIAQGAAAGILDLLDKLNGSG